MSTQLSLLIRRLGGPRLAAGILLDALGTGVMIPLSVLFFTLHQHMAATTVGLGLTVGGAGSLFLTPLSGHLIDSLGSKRALLGAYLIQAAAYVCFPEVRDLAELAVLQLVLTVAAGMSWNAIATLLTGLSGDADMSKVMATNYSLRNFGYGAGGLLATLALAVGGVGFDIAVYANAASFLIAAALALGVGMPARTAREAGGDEDPTTVWTVLRDRRYVALALLFGLLAFNQTGLQVVLPLWVVLHTHAPKELVGLLFTLNTVLVVVLQLRFSAGVGELADAPRAYLRAAGAMAAAAGAYVGAHYVGAAAAIVLLVIGTGALTATEMWATSCQFVVSIRLAHAEHRGKYLSVFGIGWGIENMAGPSVGTGLLSAGLLVPWPALAVIVAGGALASAAIVRATPGRTPAA